MDARGQNLWVKSPIEDWDGMEWILRIFGIRYECWATSGLRNFWIVRESCINQGTGWNDHCKAFFTDWLCHICFCLSMFDGLHFNDWRLSKLWQSICLPPAKIPVDLSNAEHFSRGSSLFIMLIDHKVICSTSFKSNLCQLTIKLFNNSWRWKVLDLRAWA